MYQNHKFKCPYMESCENYVTSCPYYMAPTMSHQDFLSEYQFPNPDFIYPVEAEYDMRLTDYGQEPFVVNIEDATERNSNFRTALWTGKHLQLTLMSINPGEDVGLEVHPNTDQFIRIEEGQGQVRMGDRKDRLDFQRNIKEDDVVLIPAGKWHNLINTGRRPIKLYSIYAPPEHPRGTIHRTKAEAEAAEKAQNR